MNKKNKLAHNIICKFKIGGILLIHEIYKNVKEIKDYKTEKNYLYNARCMIYKRIAEKLEMLKQKPIGI